METTNAASERARQAQRLADAVLYAVRVGCFFPVPEPRPRAALDDLIRWGAMRHLHDAIAEYRLGCRP